MMGSSGVVSTGGAQAAPTSLGPALGHGVLVAESPSAKRAREEASENAAATHPPTTELSTQQLMSLVTTMATSLNTLSGQVSALTTTVSTMVSSPGALAGGQAPNANPSAQSQDPRITEIYDPALRYTKESERLIDDRVKQQVNKIRALNSVKFEQLKADKAFKDTDDSLSSPLAPEVPRHIRQQKALVLHGKGGVSADVLIEHQNEANELNRKYQIELLRIEAASKSTLIQELEREMKAASAVTRTALNELYLETALPADLIKFQINSAMQKYETDLLKVTATVETDRVADAKKVEAKKLALEKKKLEALQKSEGTSLSALVTNTVRTELAVAAVGADSVMGEEYDANVERARLQDKQNVDRSVGQNLANLTKPAPKQTAPAPQNQKPKKKGDKGKQQQPNPKNGSAGQRNPPQTGETKKKKKRGGRGKGAAAK